MAGLLNKVKASAAKTATKAAKKETIFYVGVPAPSENPVDLDKVGKSVKELVALSTQVGTLNAKMEVHKSIVKNFAQNRFVGTYADLGAHPETPIVVQNADGERVTYVVQDRSSQYNVKPEQIDALKELFGEDGAKDLLYEETTFSFNRDIMAVPGVSDVVEKALESAIKKLTTPGENGKPVLSPEVAESLLDVKVKTAFLPGTMDRLAVICGRDAVKIDRFIEIMGSSCTRYIKC